jgi:purine-nucleoside phosphorylase
VNVRPGAKISTFTVTNATGSLNPNIPVGTIVIIQDHLSLPSLTGMNPLLGPCYPPYPRFLPMSNAYSRRLRKLVFHAFYKLQTKLQMTLPEIESTYGNGPKIHPEAIQEGTYAYVSGPTYETPAEGRFLRNSGADVVGMSTIPEVIVAREEDMEVCVLSLVTNFVVIPQGYRSIREEVEAEVSVDTCQLCFHAEVDYSWPGIPSLPCRMLLSAMKKYWQLGLRRLS